jgi:hypothetical protein
MMSLLQDHLPLEILRLLRCVVRITNRREKVGRPAARVVPRDEQESNNMYYAY